jgi:ribosomal-protein-alanine N-acetyltransferase
MTYRPWDYEDILPISALEGQCFAGERWTYAMFAASFAQAGFFGELCEDVNALGEKTIVAYGCVQCVADECDLLNIAVAEEYRRAGLGKIMLSRLMSGAKRRGAEKMFLEVRQSNAAARGLYLQAGFEEIGVRKKYYPDGENAVVMVKAL